LALWNPTIRYTENFYKFREHTNIYQIAKMAAAKVHTFPLPILTEGWTAEKDFKSIGGLSKPIQREVEPVGPHFLAHARRKRYKRTFSEDERIQAQQNVTKVEEDESGEISEPEDPLMLQRDAKDWKVRSVVELEGSIANEGIESRSLCGARIVKV
jgi:hypothetical protein